MSLKKVSRSQLATAPFGWISIAKRTQSGLSRLYKTSYFTWNLGTKLILDLYGIFLAGEKACTLKSQLKFMEERMDTPICHKFKKLCLHGRLKYLSRVSMGDALIHNCIVEGKANYCVRPTSFGQMGSIKLKFRMKN